MQKEIRSITKFGVFLVVLVILGIAIFLGGGYVGFYSSSMFSFALFAVGILCLYFAGQKRIG